MVSALHATSSSSMIITRAVSLSGTGESTSHSVDHDHRHNYRPTNERGEWVVPSDLDSHRHSHRFRGPCCLCPMNAEADIPFIEAAIYKAPIGDTLENT
jgi:hypothetical protein